MRRATPKERFEFTAKLLKLVPTATEAHAAKLLRWGATYGRLSEAECNGDWPCDNGSGGAICFQCQSTYRGGFTGPTHARRCPSCRSERIIRETCESMGQKVYAQPGVLSGGEPGVIVGHPLVVPHFQGDPRGFTVRLQIAGQPLDAYERAALAVPTS